MQKHLKNYWTKFLNVFKKGLTPKALALSITIAVLIAVFPILGIDVIVLTCIAIPMRLNLPIMIAVNYAATPLKFLTLIPFINFGGSVFGTNHTLLTYEAIKSSFEEGFFTTINSLTFELICGMVGWLVFAIPLSGLVFYLLKVFLKLFVKTKAELEVTS